MCVWWVPNHETRHGSWWHAPPKSLPGESAFAGGKHPQRRSFRAWGLDPHETRFTRFSWGNWHHGDTWFLKIWWVFEEKKVIHWKISRPLDWNWGAFRLVSFDWHVDEKTSCKLHSRHIPDPRKTSLVSDWRIWLQREIVLESSDEASATQHGSMMWFSKMLLGCFTMPYWTPENLLYCKVGSTFLPNPPHLSWVVICQTKKNCINFYLRCKFRSWILMEPAASMRGISVVLQSNPPKAFIQKTSQSPNTQSRRPMSPAVGFYVTARTSILIQCFCGLEKKNEGWMFVDTLQGTYRLNNADWKLTFPLWNGPFSGEKCSSSGVYLC